MEKGIVLNEFLKFIIYIFILGTYSAEVWQSHVIFTYILLLPTTGKSSVFYYYLLNAYYIE